MKTYLIPEYLVERDEKRCIRCKVCVNQCTYETHSYDAEDDVIRSKDENCVNCQRCVTFCPTHAITIRKNPNANRENANWTMEALRDVKKQAESGAVILTGMGCDKPYFTYWDRLVLNASQVTNPSIDPLREPMEIRTYLGAKPDNLEMELENGQVVLKTALTPQLCLETPIMFSAMSYGAISLNVHEALARAATACGTYFNTGEGGLDKSLYKYGDHAIVQVASGRFGVHPDYLDVGAAVEIKIGQGAKPGIGGHLPGEKVTKDVARTRMIPTGTDALSPAPQHDIYSIEDLRQLIYALKEATNYTKPVSVKIAAVHNSAAIASGMVRAGADIIALDGVRGATGAAPKVIRDNVGIPIELAIAQVDQRLREEGIRNKASIVAAGGIRSSADIVKAIALGADAVYIATAALVAIGCTVCQRCYTGKCPWGIATSDPWISKRVNPDIAAERLVNLLRGWSLEIKDMMGGMGINAIESLRGNRLALRGVGLTDTELKVLGVKMAGE
ncbi:MAG: glutamate synthase-related protein [Candidatus Bathyarchaeota archaeon]|nr:glutamate synthase-related protein [Candidatus Bathyarchaeota archaeon]